MKKFLDKEAYQQGLSYQILGSESAARQTLQLVLLPGQSVVVNAPSVLYMSENVKDTTSQFKKENQNLKDSGNFFWAAFSFTWGILNSVLSLMLGLMGFFLGGERTGSSSRRKQSNSLYKAMPFSSHMTQMLTNVSPDIGYCALQISNGRMIVHDNELHDGLIINKKFAVAHTTNIALRKPFSKAQNDNPFMPMPEHNEVRMEANLNQDNNPYYHQNAPQILTVFQEAGLRDFSQVQRLPKEEQKKKEVESDEWETVNQSSGSSNKSEESSSSSDESELPDENEEPIAEQVANGKLETRELLFFQTNSNIIEKTLGTDEVLRVRPECLVAFSSSVSMKKQYGNDFNLFWGLIQINALTQKGKFVEVKGPGLIYMTMQKSKSFFKKDQLTLYFIIGWLMLYASFFVFAYLDRRELAQNALEEFQQANGE